jgi:hypothetical protein|tara:strand:+ start:64 stop:480 length:417 start_codon:yes stop_codon:yes gene_type:complete
MRNDIGEAYRRVMAKAWLPSKAEDAKLKELTAARAKSYCKATLKMWTEGRRVFNPEDYQFLEAKGNHFHTWNWNIVLNNWYDLNHNWSHWCFMKYGPMKVGLRGREHHCDRHLEWERDGALWICRRQLEIKEKLEEAN